MDDELKRESKGCRMEDGGLGKIGGKMNCKEIKEYIFDYLLGELDTLLEIRINEHLLRCDLTQRFAVDLDYSASMIPIVRVMTMQPKFRL